MLFIVALQNFVVLHTHSGNRVMFASDTAADGFNYVSFYDDDDTSNEMVFSCSAEIIIDPNDPSSFTVEDTDGDAIRFTAYTPANLLGSEREGLVEDIRAAWRDYQNAMDREEERDFQRDLDAAWEALRNFDAKGIIQP